MVVGTGRDLMEMSGGCVVQIVVCARSPIAQILEQEAQYDSLRTVLSKTLQLQEWEESRANRSVS